jgi:DNA (cytosine-5)-methyltransferase 1
MEFMKILNLYSGIGGNRKLWSGHDITAVEYDPEIAAVYRTFFPQDSVVVDDAHKFLLNHFKEYDFIWASPPCQTHSSFRQQICVRFRGTVPVYADMRLYQEILFLQYNVECDWVVENVKPYYRPLIQPTFTLQRHCFWSNKIVPPRQFEKDLIRRAQIPDLQAKYGFNLAKCSLRNKNRRQILRNCIRPDIGKYVLDEINKYTMGKEKRHVRYTK